MGAGIAQVAAEAGIEVLLYDPLPGATERAHERIRGFLTRRMEKGELSAEDAATAVGWVKAAPSLESLAAADVVVEAIPEDLDLKCDAFRRLDAAAPDGTILATNTSSLSVARIATAAASPHRVVGMHFFNPVPLMALVEVVAGPMTDAAVTERPSRPRPPPGQDAGARRRHAGLHRQPGGTPVLPRGDAHPRRRGCRGRGDR